MDTQAIPTVLTNPDHVVTAERLLVNSRIGCKSCIERMGDAMGPAHSHMYLTVTRAGVVGMVNHGCDSGSLRFDPVTKELVGHSHCTCDVCF